MNRRSRIRRTIAAAALAVGAAFFGLPAFAHATHTSPAPGVLELERFTVTPQVPGTSNRQLDAGSHPQLNIFMRFCNPDGTPGTIRGCTQQQLTTWLKDFVLRLPPGLLGNPTATPVCPTHLWLAGICPDDTVLGISRAQAVSGVRGLIIPVFTKVYNLQTMGLEPARLGTDKLPTTPPGPLPITIGVRTTSDYGIDSTVAGLSPQLGAVPAKVIQIDTTLCASAPCDAFTLQPLPGAKPFMVNPTSCKLAQTEVEARSWQVPEVTVKARSDVLDDPATPEYDPKEFPEFTPTNCGSVPFQPDVTVEPDTTQAGAPSGYKVAIQYPDYANNPIWQSALKDADVTLPEGVSLAPAGGAGLEGCSTEQFGLGNDEPVRCPDGSHIGDIRVATPVLPSELGGKAFFGPTTASGRPTPERPWKLFLLIEGHGLRIKLVGDVSVSPSGQVRTTFVNQPEVPFTRFELHTRGGNNAVLANPTTCTVHTGQAILNGYSGASVTRNPTVTPTGCSQPQPFQPVVEDASAIPSQAGANSVSHLLVSRPDRHQLLKRLHLALPPGAVGSLAAVPLCPAGVVQALESNPASNCPDASKVGHIRNTVGTENGLLTVSGSVYIGEPVVSGDAASFVIVVPAKVGPIDLGRVVVVNRAVLRPSDSGVDVLSPDIPTILEGVPLAVRRIEVTVDREGFFLNPTGCDRRMFVGTFTSDQGATARSEFATQATGCERLSFGPKLRLIAGGRGLTKANSKTPLKAIVTQKPGEANIAKARVVLPDIIRPNVPQIQKPGTLCMGAQLAAKACPSTSQIGTASVITPLLPFSLSGPVYITLRPGAPLPNLNIFLRGRGLEVPLSATNGFAGIRILNAFDGVPDVAQTRFELNVKGGPTGILLAHRDLCRTRRLPRFDATFTGHNGKVARSRPRIEAEGCAAARASVSIASRVVRLTRRGVARIKLRCGPGQRCRGRLSLRSAGAVRSVSDARRKARKLRLGRRSFSIRAGRAKVVKVKLPRRAFRAVVRRKRLRARATVAPRGGRRTTRTITLRAPRKKRR